MSLDDLESVVDRELKQLPPPQAPRTLLPRVMAALDSGATTPWYGRAWRTWPLAWQLVSAAVCVVAVVALVSVWPAGRVSEAAIPPPATEVITDTVAFAGRMENATSVAWTLWRVVLQPIVPYAFALAMVMCGACVVFGMALNYLVFGRTLQR